MLKRKSKEVEADKEIILIDTVAFSKKISTHSDITDKGQTVEIVRTGDNTNIAALTLAMLLAAFVGVLALTKKKKEA